MHYVPTPVLLLGTFHFNDRGLDAYKPQHRFDITARQAEVQEVVERLAAFKPTKIAVELRYEQQEALNREYEAFVRGDTELKLGEIYQLGFQLAKRLGHEGLFGVNAWDRYYDPPVDLEKLAQGRSATELNAYVREHLDFHPHQDLEAYAEKHGQMHLLTEWSDYYQKRAEGGDEDKLSLSLRELLVRGNRPETILEGQGIYLVNAFKIGVGNEYPGADLMMSWYSRNLRIFANLQRITEAPDERLLLIIGGGHIPILRHCVEASPEYDLVEVSEYL